MEKVVGGGGWVFVGFLEGLEEGLGGLGGGREVVDVFWVNWI